MKSITDIVIDLLMHRDGLVPNYKRDKIENVSCLNEEEARITKRKFRKAWRKIKKPNVKGVQPTPATLTLRKEMVFLVYLKEANEIVKNMTKRD